MFGPSFQLLYENIPAHEGFPSFFMLCYPFPIFPSSGFV